jgi:UDP-N-acetylmuramate--alanine ligase
VRRNGKEWLHFVGIGGAGMSGIAKVLLELGYPISGSDLVLSGTTHRLAEMGALVFEGHHPSHIKDEVDLVVVSSAVPHDNSEVVAAEARNIPVIQRAEMLGRLMREQKGIAVAGAHGKTTTTSMISLVLERNRLDPTIVVGGEINDIGGNAKLGRGEYLVAEADESDGSFLKLRPSIAVVTNIEGDHLDYYKNLDNIVTAFRQFLSLVPEEGTVILCADDANVQRVMDSCRSRMVTYGLRGTANYTVGDIEAREGGSVSLVFHDGKPLGQLTLRVPGRHNVLNALAAIAVAREIGLDFDDIAGALEGFRGVKRRFQLKGKVMGVEVIDDYAHHPTELKATLAAARQCWPAKRIIAVFQPHRFSRTKYLWPEFGKAFGDADLVIVGDIYPAGEKPIPGVSARLIVDAIRAQGQEVWHLPSREEIVERLTVFAGKDVLVLTLGAGNIWAVGEELVRRLKERFG